MHIQNAHAEYTFYAVGGRLLRLFSYSATAFTLGVLMELCNGSVAPDRRFPAQLSRLWRVGLLGGARTCPAAPGGAPIRPGRRGFPHGATWFPRKFTYRMYIQNIITEYTYRIYM